MRLKKLTIDNIASIEHAVINFDQEPLNSEHLFLITGETGAGKSTIIDCLCLVLYNNTPRLKAAKSGNYEMGDNKEKLLTNDVKQLLRRGAVSADISLTFDDNDGVPYIATWHIHRAHRKLENNILDEERTLCTDEGVNPPIVLQKKKKIDEHILKLIGLDMDQFFRTVVLAQGKFAEFLNSDDNQKSNLLEKMTGTEVYTQVGMKIYQRFSEKENERNLLRDQLQNIVLLSEDEKKQINDEIANLARQHAEVLKQSEGAKKMLRWLEDKAKNDQDLAKKQHDLDEKVALTQQADHLEDKQLVIDWDATVQPRRDLKEKQQATNRLVTLNGKKDGYQQEFDRLCAALRAAVKALGDQRQQLDDINAHLQREAPNSEMYRNIKSIKSLVGRRKTEQDNIKDFSSTLQQDINRLPKVKDKVNTSLEAQRQQEGKVKELETQYERMDVAGVNTSKDALTGAIQALSLLKLANDAFTQAQSVLNGLASQQDKEQQALNALQASLPDKQVIKERAREALEREKDWNALLQQAHKSLHQGDTCPVCGNVINQLSVPKGDDVLDELMKHLKQAEDDLNSTETNIAASRKAIKRLEQQQKEAADDLNSKVTARNRQWRQAHEMTTKCGRNLAEEAIPGNGQIDELIAALEQEVNALNERLQQANDLNNTIKAQRETLTQLTTAHNNAKIELHKVNDSIINQEKVIKDSEARLSSLTSDLDKVLTISDWQTLIARDDDFVTRLEQQAQDYQDKEATARQLSQAIGIAEAVIPAMEDNKRNITGLEDHGNIATTVPGNLSEQWRQFENTYLDWNNQINNEQDKERQAHEAIVGYLACHPGITLERITLLSQHRQDHIDNIRQAQMELTDRINHMRGEVSTLSKLQRDIAAAKPDFPEQDKDRLDQIYLDSHAKHEEMTNAIAELKARLNADENNLKSQGKTIVALENAEASLRQWSELKDEFGDAKGTKFQRIAQSYILGELLASANGYLRQFNDRYRLEAQAGSLTILVRDLLQGDLTSVNTLSGGESFMVSLALALALSSTTGKMFSVDTLFIDEGFGSLSENYLDNVMETLNRLYDLGGRRVGIISHVEMLKERVSTQIQVERDPGNNTVSRVSVV